MKNKYQKEIWTIPNILSMFRIALIPVLVWMYVVVHDGYADVVSAVFCSQCEGYYE